MAKMWLNVAPHEGDSEMKRFDTELREVLRDAERILAAEARHKSYKASYARMNPGAMLRSNVFFFGAKGQPPRMVIFGRWLYIHAPACRLPRGAEPVNEHTRRSKHLGQLHARIRLERGALPVVAAIAHKLRSQNVDQPFRNAAQH